MMIVLLSACAYAAVLDFASNVTVVPHVNVPFYLLVVVTECYNCSAIPISAPIGVNSTAPVVFNGSFFQAMWPTILIARFVDGRAINATYWFGDQGAYTVVITENSMVSEFSVYVDRQPTAIAVQTFAVDVEPENVALPLIAGGAIVAALLAIVWFADCLYTRHATAKARSINDINEGVNMPSTTLQEIPAPVAKKAAKSRLASLDVMRGICISVMIFVNSGGGG
jgi:hypothetical protein